MAYTKAQFLALIRPGVLADARTSKILPSLTAAQAALESAWGNSGLTARANNLFGIKGSYQGAYVTMATKEWDGARYYTVNAKFRKYPSWAESISDHSHFLLVNRRYRNLIGVTDYKTACRRIQQDGYATSPVYATSLIRLIERYGLAEWDRDYLGNGNGGHNMTVNKSGIITASALNVRTQPSSSAPMLQIGGHGLVLPKGQAVNIIEENPTSTWGRIGDIPGWVCMTYVDIKASL